MNVYIHNYIYVCIYQTIVHSFLGLSLPTNYFIICLTKNPSQQCQKKCKSFSEPNMQGRMTLARISTQCQETCLPITFALDCKENSTYSKRFVLSCAVTTFQTFSIPPTDTMAEMVATRTPKMMMTV